MAGDLVYIRYTTMSDNVMTRVLCVTNWIDFLSSLEASSFNYVYGHGPNAGFELIGSSVDYLKCVRDIITDPQNHVWIIEILSTHDFPTIKFPK